jgi:acyl-CoA reductase-like NAD-dependent aldehyde dehydrogenase
MQECDAPDGLMSVVLTSDADTAGLTQAPDVAMVTFTGSPAVGARIRAQATDKPVTLELGGNAWVGIFPDVDPRFFPYIVQRIAVTGFGYAGQGCLSVQNVAVWHPQSAEFVELLRTATQNLAYGSTTAPEVVSGPMINHRAAERVTRELKFASDTFDVVQSMNKVGTPAAQNEDLLIPPSLVVMDRLPSTAPISEDEIFGPVVTVSQFEGVDQFVAQVNASRYGLQTGIFTDHWPTIEHIHREAHVGAVMVNDVSSLRYDHVPFGGGILDSGQGREGVAYAMGEMTQSRFLSVSASIPLAPEDTALRPPPAIWRTGS